MTGLDIKIVRLEPMLVASFHAFSASPEIDARNKLIAWAEPKGLLENTVRHRIFGFDNPSPSPGSPNYGYEFWIMVGEKTKPEGDIKIKEFKGGLYLVTRCEIKNNAGEIIPETWKNLEIWREATGYKAGNHQWLEEHIGLFESVDVFTLDLYRPIVE
jgi:DNA gyrase inhibitor GyrI